ncbi:hypothetical protein VTI74DRAFT_1437 [Chaetomium olivicolor]
MPAVERWASSVMSVAVLAPGLKGSRPVKVHVPGCVDIATALSLPQAGCVPCAVPERRDSQALAPTAVLRLREVSSNPAAPQLRHVPDWIVKAGRPAQADKPHRHLAAQDSGHVW